MCAVLCAAGYNIRWLLRAMARLGLKGLCLRLLVLLVTPAEAPKPTDGARTRGGLWLAWAC